MKSDLNKHRERARATAVVCHRPEESEGVRFAFAFLGNRGFLRDGLAFICEVPTTHALLRQLKMAWAAVCCYQFVCLCTCMLCSPKAMLALPTQRAKRLLLTRSSGRNHGRRATASERRMPCAPQSQIVRFLDAGIRF